MIPSILMLVATLSGPWPDRGFGALPQSYDVLFNRYRNRLPVEYLRALAYQESRFNASESKASYWGLLQVGEDVIKGYNERHGTTYELADVLDPELNVRMAAETLNRIVVAYNKHPSPNLQENWANPEYVKLITAGWNSGYSEKAGVGKVATWLEARGLPVTHDNVFLYAAQAGATRHLSNLKKRTWQRDVADLYFAELRATGPGPVALRPSGSGAGLALVGLALLAGVVYMGAQEGWFA